MFDKDWTPIAGTPDYLSNCGRVIAVYKFTHYSGQACYWTFPVNTPKADRKQHRAIAVGGLPSVRTIASRFAGH